MKSNDIILSKTIESDLHLFFEFQRDAEANSLAAFTSGDPENKPAYIEKYKRHLADPTINMLTIKMGDVVVGSIARFVVNNEAGIT